MALSNLPHCLHERCIHYSHSDCFQMLAANRPPVEEGLEASILRRLRSVIGRSRLHTRARTVILGLRRYDVVLECLRCGSCLRLRVA